MNLFKYLFVVTFLINNISSEEIKFETASNGEENGDKHLKIFQSLYKKKRVEHLEAIKAISNLESVKQYKLIQTIFERAFQVLEKKQVNLRENGYIPGMIFPSDEKIREDLSLCLENAAFLSEIILRFPTISHQLLKSKKSWGIILTWGIFFASQSKFLDDKTKQLIYLVSQELGLSEKDDNFRNPYANKAEDFNKEEERAKSKKKKKSKTFKKGPQLSRNLGEL